MLMWILQRLRSCSCKSLFRVAGYLTCALSSVAIMMLYNTQLQVPGCTTVGVFCSCVWGQLGLPGRLCWCWGPYLRVQGWLAVLRAWLPLADTTGLRTTLPEERIQGVALGPPPTPWTVGGKLFHLRFQLACWIYNRKVL